MNDNNYRVFLKTNQGSFLLAVGPTVNGLVKQIGQWLKGETGKYIADGELDSVELQHLDDNGDVLGVESLPVEKRTQIITAAEQMGAR